MILKLESKVGQPSIPLITIKMQKVPLKVVLDYITQSAGLKYSVESEAVVILQK